MTTVCQICMTVGNRSGTATIITVTMEIIQEAAIMDMVEENQTTTQTFEMPNTLLGNLFTIWNCQ